MTFKFLKSPISIPPVKSSLRALSEEEDNGSYIGDDPKCSDRHHHHTLDNKCKVLKTAVKKSEGHSPYQRHQPSQSLKSFWGSPPLIGLPDHKVTDRNREGVNTFGQADSIDHTDCFDCIDWSTVTVVMFLFRHASVSSTYPCKLVRPLVGPSVTLLDFQSLVSNGRSNQKSSKNKIHLFSNFASGRTLPTHKNVYEGLNALKCIWRLKCSKM